MKKIILVICFVTSMVSLISLCLIDGILSKMFYFDAMRLTAFIVLIVLLIANAAIDLIKLLNK